MDEVLAGGAREEQCLFVGCDKVAAQLGLPASSFWVDVPDDSSSVG